VIRRRAPASSRSVDALVECSALPAEHRALVARLVRDARLSDDDSLDVAEELLWHFEDGLARGVAPADLVMAFGPLDQTATLIHRSRRRLAKPWRRCAALAAGVCLTALTGAYVSRAVALHAASPLIATPRTAPNPWDAPAWVRGAAAASTAREQARARLRDASATTRAAVIVANLGAAAALRREYALETDLAAMDIIHDAAVALSGVEVDDAVDDALERALAPDGALLRAAVVRAAYDDLLDRVYSSQEGGAQVTAKGLRMLQALRGKTNPGAAAIILEPVYFALPARRWELEREIEAFANDAVAAAHAVPNGDVGSFRSRRVALEGDPVRALRYFPITATLPRLSDAVARARAASRAIELARERRRARPGAQVAVAPP
jgi:hypothetical protein